MARWTAGGEVFHRYFSVVENDSIVLRFSTFIELESKPTLHATVLWDVPARFSTDRSRIATNANDFVLAKNTDDEFHIVLFFDLKPNMEIFVNDTRRGVNRCQNR